MRKNAKTITSPNGISFKRGQKVYSHGDKNTFGFIKDWDYSNDTWILYREFNNEAKGFRWWPEEEPEINILN